MQDQHYPRRYKLTLCAFIAIFFTACTAEKRDAVYIPTKCNPPRLTPPQPSKDNTPSQEIAQILQYTEMLERDLDFCKGGEQ